MSKVLLGNLDFRLAQRNDDLLNVIEGETEKINFSLDTIISDQSLRIFNLIDEADYHGQKMLKKMREDLIADVFGDETLFEGFCLAFYESNENLETLCEDFACGERYRELCQDPVYQKRKKYIQMISAYARAAVNLYGVVHVKELEELILYYEKTLGSFGGYERKQGNYQNTIAYTPRYFAMCTLHDTIGDMIPVVCTTIDGLFLHYCFHNDFMTENAQMMDFFKGKKREIKEDDLERFYTSVSGTSYRELLEEAIQKPIYLPGKKEFLKYADDSYYEISNAERKLKRYIESNFLKNFAKVAEKLDISTSQCIDDFIRELHNQATDVGKMPREYDPHDFLEFVMAAFQGYEVDFDDLSRTNELLGFVMKVANETRLWHNHGNTPDESRREMLSSWDDLTVVPGSSLAADALASEREELARRGIKLDLDSNATEIPMFSFPNGIHGEVKESVKKIYPNDPCPCGSGKKYKKCCGR